MCLFIQNKQCRKGERAEPKNRYFLLISLSFILAVVILMSPLIHRLEVADMG